MGLPEQARRPIAVVDIGSNSVRLVVYERLSRAPTPFFNEKALCGLARGVGITGKLPETGMREALAALRRYRALMDLMRVEEAHVLATAAARDAENGQPFLEEVEAVLGRPVQLISGQREAQLSAMGVMAGWHQPDGLVGDLGGGSLELIEIRGETLGEGRTFRLGGLALSDASDGNLKKAARLAREALAGVPFRAAGKDFYAVGGTWRSLARLHMRQVGYPLNVLHGYTLDAAEALDFCRMVQRVPTESLPAIATVSDARRPLLALGAVVLEAVIKAARPRRVIFSAMGVREGLLFELTPPEERQEDALLAAARELNHLRSRSPQHGEELADWADRLMRTSGIEDEDTDARLRRAACLLADIGWRAHPDYRGEQSLNVIAHAAFAGVDHPGRAFLALAVFYRHAGLSESELYPRVRELVSTRLLERARITAAIMRLAYMISAAMPGLLPRVGLACDNGRLVLRFPPDLHALMGDRVLSRLRQLAKLLGREPHVELVDSPVVTG